MRKVILVIFLFAITRTHASGGKEIMDHKVQPHENLFRISLMYNSTIPDIVQANPGMEADRIRSGTTIKVPKDTKIRDAAFVDALLHGKKPPVHNIPNSAADVAKAEVPNENPFAAPAKPKKSIEQLELEAALENNVPKKAFRPGNEVKISKNCETAVAVSGSQNKTLVREHPLPVSLFDRQMEQLINGDESLVEAKPSVIKPAKCISAESPDCAQKTNPEPAKADIICNDVQAMNASDRIGVVEGRNAEILKQLSTLIDTNQILAINLQIVMKDGTVRTISSHQEQKKILAQLASGSTGY